MIQASGMAWEAFTEPLVMTPPSATYSAYFALGKTPKNPFFQKPLASLELRKEKDKG